MGKTCLQNKKVPFVLISIIKSHSSSSISSTGTAVTTPATFIKISIVLNFLTISLIALVTS